MERRKVVITGLGAVTPIGLTAGESWQSVKNGVCGIGPITHYDPAAQKVKLAAEVKGFDPEAAYTSGNAQGIEYGSMPTMRSLGFNINLAF